MNFGFSHENVSIRVTWDAYGIFGILGISGDTTGYINKIKNENWYRLANSPCVVIGIFLNKIK